MKPLTKKQTLIVVGVLVIGAIAGFIFLNNKGEEQTNMNITNTETDVSGTTGLIKEHKVVVDKPYVTVSVDISGAKYDVRVNDVSVISDERGFSGKSSSPVNQWLRNGVNNLSVHLSPLPGEDIASMKASVSVHIRPLDGDESSSTEVLIWNYDGKTDSDVKVGDKEVAMNKKFLVDLPFPQWKWFTSDVITHDEDTRKDLLKEYQKILKAVESRNVESVIPDFNERFTELAISSFKSVDTMTSGYGLVSSAKDQELELSPVDPDDSPLVVFGDGHLAKIIYWDGSAFIGFNFKDGSGSEEYNIIFRRKNGKWIITR